MQAGSQGRRVDPEAIITDLYPVGSRVRDLLLRHGELVAAKALATLARAPWIDADCEFVFQAAMLHDIGVGRTRSPTLGCTGALPYVCHGVEGRIVLDALELPRHGLVCERHVGVGICRNQILRHRMPLPVRDMRPVSAAERLICYADKFYSKSDNGRREKSVDEIVGGLNRYGADAGGLFLRMHREFSTGEA
jgi:uncharacterized protein